ncbi:MAG TPA: hypothetical protein DCY72_00495 [Ruminococcaceae bacterium]|nr:hypothetical protein [Oscillospiraceae bacterium]
MKKILALLLAVLMLASVLAACGGNKTTNDQKSAASGDIFHGENDIKLLVWAPEAAVQLTQTLCENFKSEHSDKNITIEVKPQEEGDVAAQILNDPEVAGDVFSFACDQMNRLDKSKVLDPVPSDFVTEIKERDSESSIEAATMKGELLAYPETGENGYYLVYDKSVVTDEDAKTFEGVLAACKKAGRKFSMDAGNGFYSCMFMFTGGLEIQGLSDAGVQQFNNYDEEKVVDSLEAFANLFHEYSDIFQSDNVDKIGSGMAQNPRSVAAGIDGSWNAATIKEKLGDDYGAAKLPTINIKGTDTQIISMSGYKLIGVNALSKFPYSAHALANYLAGEKCQLERAEKLSWSPSNKVAVESDTVKANLGSMACLEQAKHALPQVNIADTFWSPMGTLGNYLVKTKDITRDGIKTEFTKTITNIKDE